MKETSVIETLEIGRACCFQNVKTNMPTGSSSRTLHQENLATFDVKIIFPSRHAKLQHTKTMQKTNRFYHIQLFAFRYPKVPSPSISRLQQWTGHTGATSRRPPQRGGEKSPVGTVNRFKGDLYIIGNWKATYFDWGIHFLKPRALHDPQPEHLKLMVLPMTQDIWSFPTI